MATRTLEIIVNSSGSAKGNLDSVSGSIGKIDDASKKAAGGVKGLSSGVSELADSLGLPTSPAALATAGIAAVGAAVVTSVNAAREGRAAQAQLAAVLESTGHAAGISQEELNKHAEALQNLTNYDDEAIAGAQSLLLTFTRIGGDVLPDATKTVLDMSTALGQDLKSSSIQLGKALNDPINGITALTRVGVTFTDEQKSMIRSMVQAGDVAGAQAVILAELEKEFGGSAEAAREADGGFIALGNSLGNLTEAAGELVLGLNDSTGATGGLISAVDNLTEMVTEAGEAIRSGPVGALEALGAIANPLTPIMAALGMDVFPGLTASSTEAAAALSTQAEAHSQAAAAAGEQIAANQELSLSQVQTLTDLAQLEQDFNEKKNSLLDNRLQAESDASEATAQNYREMNEKLNQLASEQGTKDAAQLAAKKAQIIQNYNEENAEIQSKLDERQAAIDEQLRKEEEAYKAKAEELKLVMAAQVLQQSGQLEELTGIAGITAQQYVDAVKFGAIESNKEVETAMSRIVKGFEGAARSQESVARTNAESIKRILGESASQSASGWKRATDSIVSDFERQARAAYQANMATRSSTSYSGGGGRRMAKGGSFTVPPGYPNDSFPMWVESGERVSVIPRDQASRMPAFARGTDAPPGFKPDGEGNFVHNSYQPGYVWNGSRYVPPGGSSVTSNRGTAQPSLTFDAARRASAYQQAAANSRTASSWMTVGNRSAARSTPSLPLASPAPVQAAIPSMSGGAGATYTIQVDYRPTVSLASQYELETALDPVFVRLAKKHGIQVAG